MIVRRGIRRRNATAPLASRPPTPGSCSFPPYSPNFNPIENAFARLKALLHKAAERIVDGLWCAIGRILASFSPTECANYSAAAGYDPA